MARKTMGEMVSLLRDAKTKEQKLDVLKKHDCVFLRELLKINFDKSIQFALPKGAVEYRSKLEPSAQTHLIGEWRRFKRVFLEGGADVKPHIREANFTGLLRSLDEVEAGIVLELKDKKLTGVTREIVEQAYPGLLEPLVKKTKVEEIETPKTNAA